MLVVPAFMEEPLVRLKISNFAEGRRPQPWGWGLGVTRAAHIPNALHDPRFGRHENIKYVTVAIGWTPECHEVRDAPFAAARPSVLF